MILVISFLAAILAYVIVQNIKPVHEVHFSYLVSLSERESLQAFRFDGFYALQATDLFAATLAKWVQTPEVIVAAYAKAELEVMTDDPRQLTKQVRSEKTAPQLVEISVLGESKEEAQRLAEGLRLVMEENVRAYHEQGVPAASFSVMATDPWTGTRKFSPSIITLATFLFTFFIGLNIVLLLESLRISNN